MDKSISAEYILYACDDDYELAEKLCQRLNGLCINFSVHQIKRLRAQKLLLQGKSIDEVSEELSMLRDTLHKIRRKMISDGLVYYYGESYEQRTALK